MSSIFDGCHITFSGVFTAGNHARLTSIVSKHGGQVSPNLSKKSTHLIVAEGDYNQENSKVLAVKNKFDKVSIVTWKWVEDSIEKNTKLVETDYAPSENSEDIDMEDANDDSIVTGKHKQDESKDDKVDDACPSRKRRRTAKKDANKNDAKNQNSTATTSTTKTAVQAETETTTSSMKRKGKQNATIPTIDQDQDDADQNDEVLITQAVDEKKMVKVVVKGKAPVDEAFSMRDYVHVYSDDEIVWDALLNCTNISNNNNKYYVIQLLQTDSLKEYYVFNKWGRVGYSNSSSTYGPTSLDIAKREFAKKFKDKTGNDWLVVGNDISKFVPKKSYTLLERDYSTENTKNDEQNEKEDKKKTKNIDKELESKLHPKVQDIMEMIFDMDQWKESLMEFEYDSAKLPLGKIGKSTINQGYSVLKRIEAVLLEKSTESLENLSNEFYTVIPHSFRMRKPDIINNVRLLRIKMEMVETLGEIEIATSLTKELDTSINQLDSHYRSLNLERMEPLDHDSNEFKMVVDYVKNTHGATHYQFKLEVMEVFDLERKGERERFKPFLELPNRTLLWHGSRLTNFAGILSQGLRIAPPSAPVSGYMFGKGVYFADSVSKSAQYVHCFSGIGLMLLSEVALGDMFELDNADYDADKKAKTQSKHSVKGCGRTAPSNKSYIVLENGCLVPCGKDKVTHNNKCLQYNEYIVYDESQIMQKYLIKMKFK